LLALSDSGILFRHALPAGDQPVALQVRRLLDGTGDPRIKKNRDSEAMALAGSDLWVSFERHNVVWRYDRISLKGEAAAAPAAMRGWYKNRAGEAMARLADGRFLIVAERSRRGPTLSDALLFEGDPAIGTARAVPLLVHRPRDYSVTDAALLPDGRLLLLYRRFGLIDGFSAKLGLVEKPQFEAGAMLKGREIAHFEQPVTTDNMEGLSVTSEKGRIIVWIASDDNYMGIQRTLLLKFALAE
jgi:hypothetical protein